MKQREFSVHGEHSDENSAYIRRAAILTAPDPDFGVGEKKGIIFFWNILNYHHTDQ